MENISIYLHRSGSLLYVLFLATISPTEDTVRFPLYPHKFDDLIFLIYQRENLMGEIARSSATPIMQWLIFISVGALILYALRRLTNVVRSDHLLGSFVDSMGVFLGVALSRIGNHRVERWFLISFSIFGMLYKALYTDNLFAMFTAPDQNRITSTEQLFQANIPITVAYSLSNGDEEFYIRIKL